MVGIVNHSWPVRYVKGFFWLAGGAAVVLGCAPSREAILQAISGTQDAWTPIPSQTPLPTYTQVPPSTVLVTRVVFVTVTSSPTTLLTPTETPTPTATPTVTRTPNATQTAEARLQLRLTADKGDGFYLVNVEIAPGVWRSTGTGTNCYWATTTRSGDIIDNHYGMAGGTAYVHPSAFQVEFSGCGKWVFLSGP